METKEAAISDQTLAAQTKTKVPEEREDLLELAKSMIIAALVALAVRSFLFEPFNIPSSSMVPTLLVGDYLFVEKYAYGYSQYSFPFGVISFNGRILQSEPKRGDVAVFRLPSDTDVDYIKRIIGLPGDRIQVIDGILNINDAPVMREYKGTEDYNDKDGANVYHRYIETLPNGVKHYIYEISDQQRLDNTPVYTVPAGHYFAMGDNRDNSKDSRVLDGVGFVPAQNLVGRAWFLFFSTEGADVTCQREGSFALIKSIGCKIVTWPVATRYSRMFKRVREF